MKILLTGGGSLGPVTPLLALVEYWRAQNVDAEIIFVGTKKGPERMIVEEYDLPYTAVTSFKAPRYATLYWLAVPYLAIRALVDAWRVLRAERPEMIVTAGGYVSVPFVVLGSFMKMRTWVHQQDVVPGLANKIMARFATHISVTFDSTREAFPSHKSELTGNAVRPSMLEPTREESLAHFDLAPDRKTLLVFGGGTGSSWINQVTARIAPDLSEHWQVLHITGVGKEELVEGEIPNYHVRELVGREIAMAMQAADVVLCRAGLGTLTELAHIGKPAIVVPMPDSHQEMNAFYLYEHQAAIIMDQTETTPQMLLNTIRNIIDDVDAQMRLAANMKLTFPKDGTAHIANGILELAREAEEEWQRAAQEQEEESVAEVEPTLVREEGPALSEPELVKISSLGSDRELTIAERVSMAMEDQDEADETDENGDDGFFHVSRL